MSNAGGECSVDGCPNPARRSGLCWGHVQRRKRKRVVNGELREIPKTPWGRLVLGCYQLIESLEETGVKDPREQERKAQSRFLKVLARYNRAKLVRAESISRALQGNQRRSAVASR